MFPYHVNHIYNLSVTQIESFSSFFSYFSLERGEIFKKSWKVGGCKKKRKWIYHWPRLRQTTWILFLKVAKLASFQRTLGYDRFHPNHGLRTPGEKIAFTARPKIQSQSQILRYGRSIFCRPHQPKFSDFFDFCLHWVSVVRGLID